MSMNVAAPTRSAFDGWSASHTAHLIDSTIASWSSPFAHPEDVLVVVALEGDQVQPAELQDLHRRIRKIARRARIELNAVIVRTLDSKILMTDAGLTVADEPAGGRA